MPESQGTISYTTDIETASVLKAEKVVDKVTDNIVKDFQVMDKQTAQSGGQFGKFSKDVNSDFKKLDTQVTKTSKAVKTGIAGMGRASGQAGIQFQQFIGQVQGGQSAMLALSQQSADLGFVLGAPLVGAVVGIAASMAGILAPELLKSTDLTKNLEEELKKLVATTTLTEAQATALGNIEKKSNEEREKSLIAIYKEEGAKRVSIQASDKLVESLKGEEKFYGRIIDGNKKLKAELNGLVAQREILTAQIDKSNAKVELYNSLVGDKATTATKKQTDAVDNLITALVDESNALGMTSRQKALLTAVELNASEQDLESINRIYDKIEAYDAETKAIKKRDAESAKTKRVEETEKKTSISFATAVTRSDDTPEKKLEEEQTRLLELKAKYVEDSAVFDEALTVNAKKQADLRTSQATQEFEDTTAARQSLDNAILNSAQALTSDLAANAREGSALQKAAFYVSKGLAIAQAIVYTELAAVAALAPPPIGLGPCCWCALRSSGQRLGLCKRWINRCNYHRWWSRIWRPNYCG